MRLSTVWPMAALAVVVTVQCGGTTSTGGGADASTDAAADGSSGGGSGSGSGSGSGGGSGSGSGGGDSGGACNPACGPGRICCSGACVNPDNDPQNCGGCGIQCTGSTSYCNGTCQVPPCTTEGGSCGAGETCCGSSCCQSGQICCMTEGPQSGPPSCYTPTASQPTCPQGCAPQCISDRNLKRDVEPVDEQAVLDRVASMPVATWSYVSDDPSVRHLGPMAQDFHAAFGLGDTDRAYDPIDAHGVAFAAIKALAEKVRQQDARIERLEKENAALRQRAR